MGLSLTLFLEQRVLLLRPQLDQFLCTSTGRSKADTGTILHLSSTLLTEIKSLIKSRGYQYG